jgi:uncharacterized protein (TIGR02246 family)
MRLRIPIVPLLLAGLACAGEAPTPDADTLAIRALLERSADANNAGDIAGWVALFADDAVYMPDNSPPITTRNDLERVAVSGFGRYRNNIRIEPVEIVLLGDWAFAQAHVTGNAVPRGSGNPVVVDRKEIVLFRRQADGNWRIARLIGNSNRAR